MIEVNLLPGAAKRARRRKAAFSLGSLGGKAAGVRFGKLQLAAVGTWVLSLAAIGWMRVDASAQRENIELEIEQAVQDSARYAALIASAESLRARRDTIAQKLQVIQEIDAGRYIWAHVMDEVGRAVPDYTWLTSIDQLEGGPYPRFRIEGRTGNTFALTEFMKNLEESPFIRGVRLASTDLVREGDRLVHSFSLEATYEEPPPELIETVPLFMPPED
ncbi:MAG TPA: PilN domain-containing protein [Longimicrobiales bacterium]|nr:PilN domain-containing protein [Longimicrobiales bacterium]